VHLSELTGSEGPIMHFFALVNLTFHWTFPSNINDLARAILTSVFMVLPLLRLRALGPGSGSTARNLLRMQRDRLCAWPSCPLLSYSAFSPAYSRPPSY